MSPHHPQPLIVLLQVRSHPVPLHQEREWFRERCGVDPRHFRAINLVDHPELEWSHVADADAVMIGGAGAHSAHENHPFTRPLWMVVHRLLDEGRPLFGSCWGHQFLARVLGGTVIHDPPSSEVGTFSITLTAEGLRDPLFEGFPATFDAQLGHNDRIGTLPETMVELARSERCPYQAVRVEGRPAYGTQFHPEMTSDQLKERLEIYRDEYVAGPGEFERLTRRLRPSPHADRLLRRFLDLYVG